MTSDDAAEFYADLCDAVFRGTNGWPEDGFSHTSSESRAASNLIIDVLDKWNIDHPMDPPAPPNFAY